MRRRFFNNNNFDINNYLTIEALEDNLQVMYSGEDLMYYIDGLGWQKLVSKTYSPVIRKGQTISFKGNLTPGSSGISTFSISKKCNLKGNCMSLLFGDNAVNNNSLSGKDYAFYMLFYNCTSIVSVSKDFLPATTLATDCYSSMFYNCTSLTTAPELPATTLAEYCYSNMFYGCSRLTTAPVLPATTLAYYCYASMFSGCSKLNYIKMLATDKSATGCLAAWVYDVASYGTFVKNKNATWNVTGVNGVPSGWTIQKV